MRRVCLIFFLYLVVLPVTAQVGPGDTLSHHTLPFFNKPAPPARKLMYDSSSVQSRSFSEQAVNSYKNEEAFQYEHIIEPPRSWWDKLWTWFWFKIDEILSTREGKNTMWTIGTILAAGILVFFAFKVSGMDKTALFGQNTRLAFSTSIEDIHDISFTDAIETAINKGNYRLAVRLLYLQALKKLSDKNLIDWQINKTNSDYLKESASEPWYPVFRKLTFSFEYAWYGEAEVDKEHFKTLQQQFTDLHNQLDS